MCIRLRSSDGNHYQVPSLTPCVILPKKYSYHFGLSRIEDGWAIFDAGKRYEARCPAKVTSVAHVPDLSVVLVPGCDGRWMWTQVHRVEEPTERFELLELDDIGYQDETPPAPPRETIHRFQLLELDS